MKINVVIDASGIFYRSLFTVGNYGIKKGQNLLETEESQAIFMRKLATDFSALVRSIDDVDRVIVALDSSSWRKSVEIKGHGGYKSNRKKDKEGTGVDWDAFFARTEDFVELLRKHSYLISKIPMAEGDDLLFLWAQKLNSMGESVVMVTGDKDLHQVVKLNENGTWTVALDPVSQRRKIFLDQDTYDIVEKYDEADDVADFLNPASWSASPQKIIETLVRKNGYLVIDPVQVATKKVIIGDQGDAVPGVVTWPDPKDPEKIRGLTDSKLKKMLMKMGVEKLEWMDLGKGIQMEEMTEALGQVIPAHAPKPTVEEVQHNINRNIRLVVLDESVIPEPIQDAFAVSVNEVAETRTNMRREHILEGTEWWKEKSYTPKNVGVSFEGIEDDDVFNIGGGESSAADNMARDLGKKPGDSEPLF